MPILYPHQMKDRKDRNAPKKEEPKYPLKSWVQYEGKQWQVIGFKVEDGRRIYELKAPTADGFGEYATAHQRELSAPNAIAISESDRAANRDRVMSEATRYKRD
jgi:hypothetical protein